MRHAVALVLVVSLGVSVASGCGVTAPIEKTGNYGVEAVKDDNGDDLLTQGDTGEEGLEEEEQEPPPPAEEGQVDEGDNEVDAIFPNGSTVVTTGGLNLRSGPGTTFDVLRAMPVDAKVVVVDGVATDGFIKVTHEGLEGFASYRYLRAEGAESPVEPEPEPGETPPPAGVEGTWREKALSIAANGVGLSYWWGHGKLVNGPASPSQSGSCSGSCPSCSHSGTYGADCSGYVAKAWVVPSSNTSLDTDTHPYSTADFNDGTGNGKWSTISKSATKAGDAMVYRSGGGGHIFIYEKGDAWGQPWAYEARGCSYGIVHNIRSTGAAYKAITKN